MAFQVFQNGKACGSYKMHESWKKDTFDTKREAEVYAYAWAYPMSYTDCVEFAPTMELGREYNYATSEFPVMMKIMEVNTSVQPEAARKES